MFLSFYVLEHQKETVDISLILSSDIRQTAQIDKIMSIEIVHKNMYREMHFFILKAVFPHNLSEHRKINDSIDSIEGPVTGFWPPSDHLGNSCGHAYDKVSARVLI